MPATFFVTGTWLQRNPEAVKQILAGGHEIGNHTLNHRVMLQLESREIVREIKEFNDLALSLLEYRPRLFRPPLGLYNDAVVKRARQQGCRTVLWSVESYDLISKGSEEIVERVKGRLRGGSIVVFRVGAPFLPEALVEIIADLKRRGFEAVTVSELLMYGERPQERQTFFSVINNDEGKGMVWRRQYDPENGSKSHAP